jgi:hypothetical protein
MSGRLLVHAALLLGLLGCEPKPKPRSQEQIAALQAKYDALEQRAADADLRLAEQLYQDIQRLSPDAALGPCPVKRTALELGKDPFLRTLRIKTKEPPTRLAGPASKPFYDAFLQFERSLEDEIAGEDELEKKLDAYTIEPPVGYWFVLAIETELEPKIIAEGKFMPGVLVGEFFVWDADAKQLICGAPIGSTSSEEVTRYRRVVDGEAEKIPEIDAARLRVDLQKNAINAALSQLSKLGPRAAG